MGDSAIVITGGGASPDGVKAFVTEYTGIQEGEVKNFLKMIMMIGNGVAIFCNVGQEVRSKELEQLQSARHRHAKFKHNIQNIEKVCMPSLGEGGGGVIGFSTTPACLICHARIVRQSCAANMK